LAEFEIADLEDFRDFLIQYIEERNTFEVYEAIEIEIDAKSLWDEIQAEDWTAIEKHGDWSMTHDNCCENLHMNKKERNVSIVHEFLAGTSISELAYWYSMRDVEIEKIIRLTLHGKKSRSTSKQIKHEQKNQDDKWFGLSANKTKMRTLYFGHEMLYRGKYQTYQEI
jgi:hypothetical protein